MRSASLYRVGGTSLWLGAGLFGVAVLLHVPQPTTLAALTSGNMSRWMLSHWLLILSPVGILAGSFALARHFFGSRSDGFAVLGLATILPSLAAVVMIGGIETTSFAALAAMTDTGAAEQAFSIVSAVMFAFVNASSVLFWASFLSFGLAIAQDSSFPGWLGYGGVAVGVLELAAHFTITAWTITQLLFLVGVGWLVLVGWQLARMGTRAPAESPATVAS